ncbi:hypothetical protein [Mucilaginibacter gotjawali]|uniref:Uncharacterized protein n=2 Tax=Mucilaginibacter gotjawali TaxID=1550579 RepID=A0A839S6C3_9SPHI|nr:hypothetical protein [Mucilaginibacter gotjawali]MBB3053641.1 hypothetical protein [Mucilaginibacter gotjawali]BAU53900.1 hypothetical protein MgSA37_02071 [Mucilaginibacter gotjawali]
MKIKIYLWVFIFSILQAVSCKKEAQPASPQLTVPQIHTLENGLLNFAINGELTGANIDTLSNTITVIVPDSANRHKLIMSYTLASQVTATINSTIAGDNEVYDFTQPVVFTVTSTDKHKSTSFQLIIQTEMEYFGFPGTIAMGKSLNKGYNFYLDQFDGSRFQYINCGPAVTTMAIKWADSIFSKTPVDARNIYEPKGGWWFTSDVQSYLKLNNINYAVDTLQNIDSLVKTNIDKNKLLIICLDMFYIPFNITDYQHISKFYPTTASGWGHFLLAKGYKQTGSNFYIETYDPYSQGEHYPGFDHIQLKGQDRYYLDKDITMATNNWWPYVITVAQKGHEIEDSNDLRENSISRKKTVPVAGGQ